jgi:hypothetical protein
MTCGVNSLARLLPPGTPCAVQIWRVVLSDCPIKRGDCKGGDFDIYSRYKESSKDYRKGRKGVVFPSGTYPPHLPVTPAVESA